MSWKVSQLASLLIHPWELQRQDSRTGESTQLTSLKSRWCKGNSSRLRLRGDHFSVAERTRRVERFPVNCFGGKYEFYRGADVDGLTTRFGAWSCINTYMSHFGRFCPRSLLLNFSTSFGKTCNVLMSRISWQNPLGTGNLLAWTSFWHKHSSYGPSSSKHSMNSEFELCAEDLKS